MSRYSQNIPPLEDEDKRLINEYLNDDASRRKSFVPEDPLLIRVDGKPSDDLDPYRQRKIKLKVKDEDRWIEVYAQMKTGDRLLLAAHLHHYGDAPENGLKKRHSTRLEGGQKINFSTYTETDENGNGGSFIDISYHETKIFRALALLWRRLWYALLDWLKRTAGTQRPVFAMTRTAAPRRPVYSLALASLLLLVP